MSRNLFFSCCVLVVFGFSQSADAQYYPNYPAGFNYPGLYGGAWNGYGNYGYHPCTGYCLTNDCLQGRRMTGYGSNHCGFGCGYGGYGGYGYGGYGGYGGCGYGGYGNGGCGYGGYGGCGYGGYGYGGGSIYRRITIIRNGVPQVISGGGGLGGYPGFYYGQNSRNPYYNPQALRSPQKSTRSVATKRPSTSQSSNTKRVSYRYRY